MKKFILSVVALFLLSAFLRAQEIDMSGSVAYDAVGSLVTLSVDRIDNLRKDFSFSGPLAIQLWATTSPYNGETTLQGYKLAERPLGVLESRYYEVDPIFRPLAG